MGDDRHTDAAAVPVPDAGDDTLRDELTRILTEHQFEFSVDRCAWLCVCSEPPMPMHNDALRHQADALLPRIRDHVAGAVQAERERAIEAIKIRREHRIATGDHLGHLSGLYEAIRLIRMHDPTNDTEATPHDFESLPVDEYAASRAERERRQRERMDAAYEKAKAEKEMCGYVGGRDDTQCLLAAGHDGTHHFGTKAGAA